MEAIVSDNDKWSGNMRTIIIDNDAKSRTDMKSSRDVADQLRTHNGKTFVCRNYQQLLKVDSQNHDQSNLVKSPQPSRKACNHE